MFLTVSPASTLQTHLLFNVPCLTHFYEHIMIFLNGINIIIDIWLSTLCFLSVIPPFSSPTHLEMLDNNKVENRCCTQIKTFVNHPLLQSHPFQEKICII